MIVVFYNLVASLAYIHRGDYFHKQTDQFVYLSLADSLRLDGVMRARVDLELSPIPRTATTGASLFIFPFSRLSMDKVFGSVVFVYLALGLISLFPLFHVLLALEVKRRAALWTLLLYAVSFSLTIFKILPVNEGPSLFFTSWFLFFVFAKPSHWRYPAAALSAIFRAHIFILSLALLIFYISQKKVRESVEALSAFLAGLVGIFLYRLIFPFTQIRGTGLSEFSTKTFFKDFSAALSHLFVPETVFETLFKSDAQQLTAFFGLLILITLSFLFFKQYRKNSVVGRFGLCVFIANIFALASWPDITARFLVCAFLWLVALVVDSSIARPKTFNFLVSSWLVVQCLLLGAYSFSKSTDPFFSMLEEIKSLSLEVPRATTIYYDDDFTVHGRQIYGPFRRPVRYASTLPGRIAVEKNFAILTVKPQVYESILQNCAVKSFRAKTVTLLGVTCL